MSIRTKFFMWITIMMALFCAVSYVNVSLLHGWTYRTDSENIKGHTESAYNVINYFYLESMKGKLPEDMAKSMAMEVIKNMRYGNGGYFWINDSNGVLLMHPVHPEVVGKNRWDFKDANGKFYYRAFVEVADGNPDGGLVDYLGPRPGNKVDDNRVAKISFVKKFRPWDWIVGTGMFVQHVEEKIYKQDKSLLLSNFIGASALLMLLWIFLSPISDALRYFKIVTEKLANNMFSFEISNTERNDEIGEIGRNLSKIKNSMLPCIGCPRRNKDIEHSQE